MILVKGLVVLYGIVTTIAGVINRPNIGVVASILFSVTGLGMAGGTIFLKNDALLILLIFCFIILHILAIWVGIMKNGALTLSHHIVRLFFHMAVLFVVYYLSK